MNCTAPREGAATESETKHYDHLCQRANRLVLFLCAFPNNHCPSSSTSFPTRLDYRIGGLLFVSARSVLNSQDTRWALCSLSPGRGHSPGIMNLIFKRLSNNSANDTNSVKTMELSVTIGMLSVPEVVRCWGLCYCPAAELNSVRRSFACGSSLARCGRAGKYVRSLYISDYSGQIKSFETFRLNCSGFGSWVGILKTYYIVWSADRALMKSIINVTYFPIN